MKARVFLIFCQAIIALSGTGQYLQNPSFEGTPQVGVPPPGWSICQFYSTPDIQPGVHGVSKAASDGYTYVGMTVRDDNTWEEIQTNLLTPLSPDSCYHFQIDMYYTPNVSVYNMEPIIIKIYGESGYCAMSNLLWQSPLVDNLEWETFDFYIQPAFSIEYLIIEVSYYELPPYWGYALMDNIRIETDPHVDLGNDTIISQCEADSLLLNPDGEYFSYLWQDGSTDSVFWADTTGWYWVQVTNVAGCTAIDSIHITIEEYVDMTTELADTIVVCEGETAYIELIINDGAPPYFIDWIGLINDTTFLVVTPEVSTWYVVEITDQCENVLTDSVFVEVNQGPVVDLGQDTILSLCDGNSLLLIGGPGYWNFEWQDGSTDSVYNVTQTGFYWVTVINEFGCETSDSIFVTIEEYLPMTTEMIDSTQLCEGGSVDLEIVVEYGAPPYEYDWTGVAGNDAVVTITPTETSWYYVTVIDNCEIEATDSVLVKVFPAPQVDLGGDTALCIENTPLTLNAGGGYNIYSWEDGSTEPIHFAFETGLYHVTVVDQNGCEGYDDIFVQVSDPNVDLGGDGYLCEGDSLTLDAGEGYSYFWNTGTTSRFYTVTTGGTYTVWITDSIGCQDSASVTYSYYPKPLADLGPDRELCAGETIILTAIEGDFIYLWNGQPGNSSYLVEQQGQYTLEIYNLCDTATGEVYVTSYPLPEVDLGPDMLLLPGESVVLDAGDKMLEYLWQDGSSGRFYEVNFNDSEGDEQMFSVEVYDGHCYNSDSLLIEFFTVKVPNVFTPNGDGFNDYFRPMEDAYAGVKESKVVVLNRWGRKMWESDHFEEGWDGKINGTEAAPGVYYWVLEVSYGPENKKKMYKGSVTLLR